MLQKIRKLWQIKGENQKKIIFCIVIAVVCAVGLEWMLTADFHVLSVHGQYDKEIYAAPQLDCYNAYFDEQMHLITTSEDPYIIFENLGQYVDSVTVVYEEPVQEEYQLQINFLTEGQQAYDDEHLITAYTNEGMKKLKLDLGENVQTLRLDLDDRAGETIPIAAIILNDCSYRDLIFPFQENSPGRIAVYVLVFLLVSFMIIFGYRKTLHYAYQYRFIIGIGVVVLFTICKINGSSITAYYDFLPGYQAKPALGIAREVRSDEFSIFTTMAVSQERNHYQYFSDLFRGTRTDMAIVYGQPIRSIITLFRPFLLGYLFLGSEYGLAFYWSSRLVALFLVMFELFMLLTNQRKYLSLYGAITITFAPIVQWWFSINGIVELLVFSSLAVILFDRYLSEKSGFSWKKLLYTLTVSMCAGGFVLVFYPAWQIPVFYMMLVLLIWVIIKNRKKFHFSLADAGNIFLFLFVLAGLACYVYTMSFDTIQSVLHTEYPGNRVETGGSMNNLWSLFGSWINIYLPYMEKEFSGTFINVCEIAGVFDLFPIGMIFCIYAMIKRKKTDSLSTLLLGIEVVYLSFFLGQWPEWLAKATLFSNVLSNRLILTIGIVNVFLLVRGIANLDGILLSNALKMLIAGCFAFAGICVFSHFDSVLNLYTKVGILFLLVVAWYLICHIGQSGIKRKMLIYVTGFSILAGITVNPLQIGLGHILDNDLVETIDEINTGSEVIWATVNIHGIDENIPTLAEAHTLNSIQTYPDLKTWKKLDKAEIATPYYNRYARINFVMADVQEPLYGLVGDDSMTFYVNLHNLKELGVNYILTTQDLTQFEKEGANLEQLYARENYKIYRLF